MYLIKIFMKDGTVITDVLRPTLEEAEAYIDAVKNGPSPFRKAVIYENDSKEAVRLIRGD